MEVRHVEVGALWVDPRALGVLHSEAEGVRGELSLEVHSKGKAVLALQVMELPRRGGVVSLEVPVSPSTRAQGEGGASGEVEAIVMTQSRGHPRHSLGREVVETVEPPLVPEHLHRLVDTVR